MNIFCVVFWWDINVLMDAEKLSFKLMLARSTFRIIIWNWSRQNHFPEVIKPKEARNKRIWTSALLVTSILPFHESNSISLIESKFIQNFGVVIASLFRLSISHFLKHSLELFFLWKKTIDISVNWRYSFFDLRSVLLALWPNKSAKW